MYINSTPLSKCTTADEITAPRDIDIKEKGQFGVVLAWQPPECGSVGEYQLELRGKGNERFDVHRQTVAQPSASFANLLPGTDYLIKLRAVDRSRTVGPWSEQISAKTKGDRKHAPKNFEYTIGCFSSRSIH